MSQGLGQEAFRACDAFSGAVKDSRPGTLLGG
jgi:hypothetical protein